jgi:hypothetical protein
VAEGFAIQPEILYSGLGAKIAGGKILYDYLTLPVLAKYSFEDAGFGAYLVLKSVTCLVLRKKTVGGLRISKRK